MLFLFWGFIRNFIAADHVYKTIDALPVTAHPMTQFATGVMALQVKFEFFNSLFLL